MMKKIFNSHSGFSLVELVVVMAIIGLMGLGTSALVNNLVKMNSKSKTKSNIISIKDQIMKTLKDEASWQETVDNNNALRCLREDNNTRCNDNQTIVNFDVYMRPRPAPAPPLIYYRASQASRGFNDDGSQCTGYNAGGNNNCAFRYDIRVRLRCNYGEATCKSPDIHIQADFKYSPSNDRHVANSMELTDEGGSVDANWEARGKMDFEFQKSQPNKLDSFQIMFATTNAPGGNCDTNAWRRRPINYTNFNQNGAILELNRPGDWIRMRRGFYKCEIKAEAYGSIQGFKIRLRNITSGENWVVASGYSGPDTSTVVVGEADIEVTNPNHRFQIQHFCRQDNPLHNFDMGIPKPDYSTDLDGIGMNRFTIMTCTRKG